MEIERSVSPFFKIARKYFPLIKVGMELGLTANRHLDEKKNFRATPRHELVVATICDTLGRSLGLDSATQEQLNRTALVHDADKKLEIRPKEFIPQQTAVLERFMASRDRDLIAATKEQFVKDYKDKIDVISLPQMLLYYADMLVSWDQITTLKDRIAKSRSRRPELSDEFFDTELKFGKAVEQQIFDKLPEDMKQKIGEPSQMPNYLMSVLCAKR